MKKKVTQKIYNYTAIFEPDETSGFTVTIPALPGCISEGDTFEEALVNIKEAAELYLEGMQEERQSVPIESGVVIAPIQVFAKHSNTSSSSRDLE